MKHWRNQLIEGPGLFCNTRSEQSTFWGFYFDLLALVESSLEVLLMLALLSRFFLQSVSLCLVWLEEGGDEEELVLARESSSDIPVWIGEEAGTCDQNATQQQRVKPHDTTTAEMVQFQSAV